MFLSESTFQLWCGEKQSTWIWEQGPLETVWHTKVMSLFYPAEHSAQAVCAAPRRLDAAGVAAVSVVVSYLVALSMNSLSSGLDSKVITVMEFFKSN